MRSGNYLWFAAKSLLVGLRDSYQLSVISYQLSVISYQFTEKTPHTPHPNS
ncbi:hypothetical protein [Microcystis aeruginosa]|uniref:hypothetical protein n=1 Tax=Microcystis aeruginosa TaxID=1126 RepID=UPI0015628B4A|nr:hypothetical protein [Microcystis aeruginosa]